METTRRGFLKFLGFGAATAVVMGDSTHISKANDAVRLPVRMGYEAPGEQPYNFNQEYNTSMTVIGHPIILKIPQTEWKSRGKDATRT